MIKEQKKQWISIGWKYASAAGLSILVTSIYFAVVLPAFGFEFEMLDDYASHIGWYLQEGSIGAGLFQGLMIFFFVTQLLLLPVPFALHKVMSTEKNSVHSSLFSLVGTAGAIIAMISPVIFFANTPELVAVSAKGIVPMETIEMTGNMFADLTKDFRLFSELLIGIWLIGAGWMFRKQSAYKMLSLSLTILGAIIFIIPSIKLVDPFDPIEDFIGIILAISFFLVASLIYQVKKKFDTESAIS